VIARFFAAMVLLLTVALVQQTVGVGVDVPSVG
jgi:hypothetical protein